MHISLDYYEVNALTTTIALTLYLLLRDDKTDTIIQSPDMVKYFWPHTIMLLLILVPRLIMFCFAVYNGYKGKPFGTEGTSWMLVAAFLTILVTLVLMVIIYATNEKDLRTHPLIYCWSLN